MENEMLDKKTEREILEAALRAAVGHSSLMEDIEGRYSDKTLEDARRVVDYLQQRLANLELEEQGECDDYPPTNRTAHRNPQNHEDSHG